MLIICSNFTSCSEEEATPSTGEMDVVFKVVAPDGMDITARMVSWDMTIQVFDKSTNNLVATSRTMSVTKLITGLDQANYRITATGTLNDGVIDKVVNGNADNISVKAGEKVKVEVILS